MSGIEVQGIARKRLAQSLRRHVAQRVVIPRICDGKKDGAIAAYKNIFIRSVGRLEGFYWRESCGGRRLRYILATQQAAIIGAGREIFFVVNARL